MKKKPLKLEHSKIMEESANVTNKNQKYKKRKVKLKIFLVISILYIGSYIGFSCFGSYAPTQSGEVRYGFGLSASDVKCWNPKYIYGNLFRTIDGKLSYRGNIMGLIYAPLIILDQKYVHKTERFRFAEPQTIQSESQ